MKITPKFNIAIFCFSKLLFFCLLTLLTACQVSKKAVSQPDWVYFDHSNYINPENYTGSKSLNKNAVKESKKGYQPPKPVNKQEFQQKLSQSITVDHKPKDGIYTIRMYIDSTGTLKAIETIEGPDVRMLKNMAEVAKKTKFEPARLHGKPINSYFVESQLIHTIRFQH